MSDAKPLSFWSMFVHPLVTLAALAERPMWVRPILASAVISAASNLYVTWRIGLSRLIHAAAKSSAILDPQAAIQNALAHPYRIHGFQVLAAFVGSLLTALVIAKVIWLILILLGREARFLKVLALSAYVTALSAIARGCILVLTVTVRRDLSTLDLRNPLATNPAFFLQPASPALYRILSSLDVFTFLTLALLTIGLTKMCSSLSIRAASLVVVIPWAIYVGTSLLLPPLLSW